MLRRWFKRVLLRSIVPPLIAGALWLLRRTIRIEYRNDAPMLEFVGRKRSIVFAFWHADMVMILFATSDYYRRGLGRAAVLASLSQDGEVLARTVRRFGVDPVRGSSSRGARSGLKGLEHYLAATGHVGIAVDGPRGPRHTAKMGVVLTAKHTGAPIIPFSVRYEHSWRFRSWDRTEIPRPFSRCTVTFHEPITVAPTASREELERVRARVEQILLQGGPTASRPCDSSIGMS
jgi:hypothetical protein